MSDRSSSALVDALSQRDAYPWPVDAVEVLETHISCVFLAGDGVVKVKRPVTHPFVDYGSLEKRQSACEEEVRLNRLLSDNVYLGVVPIAREGERWRVDGESEPVEWGTLMRRLPADRMLDVLLRQGSPPEALADRLADRLVPFHLDKACRCPGEPEALAGMTTDVVTDNLDELAPFRDAPLGGRQLDLVCVAMRRLIAEHGELLVSRARDGWIREGRGDLRCEHVCVDDAGALQIYDCVEFNRDLRCADVAGDLAFLLMDLHRLGAPEGVIGSLLGRYRGAGAVLSTSLLRFYWVHRALVRAKVACLRFADVTDDEGAAIARKAVDRLHVAMMQAIAMRPAVIAMSGLSGSGKSTVAADLARALGARHIATDVERKALAKRREAAPGEDIYTPAWTEVTYTRVIALGEEAVRAGRAVVLDGTFLDSALREQAAEAARRSGVPFVLVETVCDDATVVRRLTERSRRGDSISDAGVEIYRRQRERFVVAPPAVPEDALHATIDTTPEGPALLDPAFAALVDAGIIAARIREDGPLIPT